MEGELTITKNCKYEFLLSHDALAKQPDRGDDGSSNAPCFKEDYEQGKLNRYRGTYVAYHKGVLCGQSKEGDLLYKAATNYYGRSNLVVFEVPKNPDLLETKILQGQCKFLNSDDYQ